MKKILIFTRCTWTLVNFRHDYIKFLENKKCNITIACDYRKQELKNLKKKFPSVSFKKINFLNKNRSIFREFKICYQIIKLLIMEKFNYIHNFTIRPVIYSTLIGKILTNAKIVNSITGLGHIFNNKESFFFKNLINIIYIISNHIIFQNKDDLDISSYRSLRKFISYSIIFPSIKESIKKNYSTIKKKSYKNKKIIFLMFCRLIKQKGVREFLNAAQYVCENYKINKVQFRLIGEIDQNNPSALGRKELDQWQKKHYIKILNHKKNILSEILKSDIVCLPSYGEGMPASLLEALYLEKAIVTTNVNGCREVVKNNFNGYLVKKKDYLSLANRFLDIINNPKLINIFGKNSKKYFEKKFSKNPYRRMFAIINSL
jgi:glycosyltransferase involved in cell wall biosynthesis